MAVLYTSTSVSGYNSNPPSDDGSQTSTNQLFWATIKSKLGDPLNTFASAVNGNIVSAFAKTLSGGASVSTVSNYAMSASDQGRIISATGSPGITITSPSATIVGAPFVFAVLNQTAGNITLAAFSGQTMDNASSQPIQSGGSCIVYTDGSNWFCIGRIQGTNNDSDTVVPVIYAPIINVISTPGTSTFNVPTQGGNLPLYMRIRMVGAGGGGGANATNSGTNGGNSAFGAWGCNAGGGGSPTVQGAGGTGGSTGVGTLLLRIAGSNGRTGSFDGGNGGASAFGGAGIDGSAASANTGSGGSGGGTGAGGGAGEFVEIYVYTPLASYSYTVGAKGTGGAAGGTAGQNGADGVIVIESHWQ